MIDEATYNELDRYFHSAMSAGEKSAFESRLSASAELREELQWLNTLLGGMKQQGRSVMKQTISNAIAGVPAASITKYKPAVNGTSFLKKWWWAVSGTVIIVAALAVYYVTQNSDQVHGEGDYYQEEQLRADSAPCDTAIETRIPDSASQKQPPIEEQSEVLYGHDTSQYDDNYKYADTARSPNLTLGATQSKEEKLQPHGSRVEGMRTSINRRNAPPYTYILGESLTLNANYSSTAGFKFRGSGDTVFMMDHTGVEYMLLRNKGELPLKPLKGFSK